MNCPPNKHEITIWLDCDTFSRISDAARYVGCGTDLERYIIGLITERC